MTSAAYPRIVERSADAANVWYGDVAAELDTDDLYYATRALRAVMHALRDRLTVEEAAQLASQLPTLIRGVFYEQWRPGAPRHLARDVNAFLAHVATEGQMAGAAEASDAVAAVARVLHRHVSEGEMDDVLAILPTRVRPLFAAAASR